MAGHPIHSRQVLPSTVYIQGSHSDPVYSRPTPFSIVGVRAWSPAWNKEIAAPAIRPRSVATDSRAGIPLYGPGVPKRARKNTREKSGDVGGLRRGPKAKKVTKKTAARGGVLLHRDLKSRW